MADDKKNVLLMMTFREAVFKFEVVSFYNTDDKQVLCDLEYIKDKYVYVFTTDPKNPEKHMLYNEYLGVGDGNFRIALLANSRGKDVREFSGALKKNLIVPAFVNGVKLELFACLSRIQLPWKRIEEIATYPAQRCYDLRAPKGGLCWIPGCVERTIVELCGVRDSRIADPGNSTVMVGLFDHLREAQRRAEQFRTKLDEYLQMRFDCDQLGKTDEMQQHLQMKKYGAGLVLNLLQSNHPHVNKFRAALKNNGRDLEDFIREENKKEIRIRHDAEKAACSLARWIDDPDDVFEDVLDDYTADPDNQDHWDFIQDFYCGLLNRFNELSITRKYVSDKWKNKGSWMQRYLLNGEAFQSYRKVTTAVAEFLGVMSEVAYRTVDIKTTCKAVEGIYRVWFRGIVLEVFSDKRVKTSQYYLTSITANPELEIVQKIRISEQCEPLEKLGDIADSKVLKGVLISFEALNLIVATQSWTIEFKSSKKLNNAKTLNGVGALLDILIAAGEASKQVGKTPLSSLGVISAAIDTREALYESIEEYKDKDYDAMVSKIVICTGAATVAVGSAMVTAAAFSAAFSAAGAGAGASLMAVAHSALIYGAGMTASGVGSPVGGALIFVGTVAVAAGTIAYFFTNDSKTETWLKQSPWGAGALWSFENGAEYGEQLDVLHGLLYAFNAEVLYDPWKKRVIFQMKSVFFQAETKIVIQEIVLNASGATEKVTSSPILVDDKSGITPLEVAVTTGTEIEVTVTLPVRTQLKSIDTIETKLQIDLFGNSKVILPERNKYVFCKSRVYG